MEVGSVCTQITKDVIPISQLNSKTSVYPHPLFKAYQNSSIQDNKKNGIFIEKGRQKEILSLLLCVFHLIYKALYSNFIPLSLKTQLSPKESHSNGIYADFVIFLFNQ